MHGCPSGHAHDQGSARAARPAALVAGDEARAWMGYSAHALAPRITPGRATDTPHAMTPSPRSLLALSISTALLFLGGCRDGGTDPTGAEGVHEISIRPTVAQVNVDESKRLDVQIQNERGQDVGSQVEITWGIGNERRAGISQEGLLEGRSPGTTEVTATAGGVADTAKVVVHEKNIATLEILTDRVELRTGEDTRLEVLARTAEGERIERPSLHWSSEHPSVADVDEEGRVTARSAGETLISATGGGTSAHVPVEVEWNDVATVDIVPELDTVALGYRTELEAVARDEAGNRIEDIEVTWSSTNEDVFQVDRSGGARAVGEGVSLVEAEVDGVTEMSMVTVVEGDGIIIRAIHPAVLRAGEEATIEGSNFDADDAEPEVVIDGAAAEVLRYDDSEIRIVVPYPEGEACRPRRMAEVGVFSPDDPTMAGHATHPLATATFYELTPGEALRLNDGEAMGCVEIDGAGDYLLSLYNSAPSPTTAIRAEVRGLEEVGGERITRDAARATSDRASTPAPTGSEASSHNPSPDGGRDLRAHLELLERNLELLEEAHPSPREVARAEDREVQFEVRPPTEGAYLDMIFPDLSNLCMVGEEISARVVYSGSRAVILEDDEAPMVSEIDDVLRAMGEEYDGLMHALMRDYFGDPLAYNDELQGNNRIFMLFTPNIPDGLAGFVSSGDFASSEECAASNEQEVFYADVPESSAEVERWHRSRRSTVFHEVKHLTAFAEKRARGGTYNHEVSWLEEATAVASEEIYARTVNEWPRRGNLGFEEGVACDLESGGRCQDRPITMFTPFHLLAEYMGDAPQRSPLRGREYTQADMTFYGSGWSLVRWVTDHHATSESGFLRDLTQETERQGVDNLEHHSGVSFREMLADYSIALAVDDYDATPTREEHRLPSWNLRDVMSGLSTATRGEAPFEDRFPLDVEEVTGEGDFEVFFPVIVGGSQAYLKLRDIEDETILLEITEGAAESGHLGATLFRLR